MTEETNDSKNETLPKVFPTGGDLEGTESEFASIGNSVLCFGEVMLRLSPPADTSWLTDHQVQVNLAGAECNVAVALAKWNVPVKYCTALPDNNVSKNVLKFLQQKGIDTSGVLFSGNRIGIYYIEHGTDLKQGGVIYDRNYSSYGELQPGMIDWDEVFKDVSWFHFSAISPALSDNAVAVIKEALIHAKLKGLTISVDLNYRSKLWQYGKKPSDVMPALVAHCDVIMGNIWAANTLLGIDLHDELVAQNNKDAYRQHAKHTAEAIHHKFPACATVALTYRFDADGGGINYYGTLYTHGNLYTSGEYASNKIVDKVGSGDCFMAGLIYGMQNNNNPEDVIEYAAAAAFGKLHETGDLTNHTVNDIQNIIKHHAYTN